MKYMYIHFITKSIFALGFFGLTIYGFYINMSDSDSIKAAATFMALLSTLIMASAAYKDLRDIDYMKKEKQ